MVSGIQRHVHGCNDIHKGSHSPREAEGSRIYLGRTGRPLRGRTWSRRRRFLLNDKSNKPKEGLMVSAYYTAVLRRESLSPSSPGIRYDCHS